MKKIILLSFIIYTCTTSNTISGMLLKQLATHKTLPQKKYLKTSEMVYLQLLADKIEEHNTLLTQQIALMEKNNQLLDKCLKNISVPQIHDGQKNTSLHTEFCSDKHHMAYYSGNR